MLFEEKMCSNVIAHKRPTVLLIHESEENRTAPASLTKE